MSENTPANNESQVTLTRKPEKAKLSNNMVANIAILVAMALISSLILLFGEFDGKIVRTVTTLLVFAAFTLFAAYDANRDAPPRYLMLSQVGHLYFIGLSLFLIWGTLAVPSRFFDEYEIVRNTILIVVLAKAAVFAIQKVSDSIYAPQSQLALSAKLAIAFLSITTFMFTLPLGTDYMLNFGEWYWKIAVFMVICAAVSLCVTLLLHYSFRTKTSQPKTAKGVTERVPVVSWADDRNSSPRESRTQVQDGVDANVRQTSATVPPAYAAQAPEASAGTDGPPSYARPVAGPQPWPVFPNGQPLPAAKNGRPDFTVLQYVASVHAEAERQWFS